MKKAGWTLLVCLLAVLFLSAGAAASGEPSGEPAPAALAETAADASAESGSIAIAIKLNGRDYRTASVGTSAEGKVYTFRLAELLAALGAEVSYDETSRSVSLRGAEDSLAAQLIRFLGEECAAQKNGKTTGRQAGGGLMPRRYVGVEAAVDAPPGARGLPEVKYMRETGRGNR